ncbi:MAG: protein kinase [Vicinamibacterales bacterium]|jgi:serine/threonine-protein kinase|nr:protein kinase [Vicinamibacterales bacterium]
MALEVGSRLGVFEVTGRLGEGGMGVVYRATDTSLNRDVALKVLPDAFAEDSERLARFQREAQVLASLNHPNIAQIHGLEQSGDTRALVLELVEGPTLQDRISQGPIPLDEALPIARQIAEALEAAHEQGIIHRDLKPANVKVKDDGTVKVLDFGLAKALEPEQTQAEAANSPTMTMTAAATKMGVIMGTAAYMAPEQAKGRRVDKRADIWAFGVLLFEMLTGRQAFGGTDISETLAAVLRQEMDWTELPSGTPHSVRRLLRRCLERDHRRRLPEIGTARLDIDEARDAPEPSAVAANAPVAQPALWQRPIPALLGLLASVIVVAVAVWGLLGPEPSPQHVTRLGITLAEGENFSSPGRHVVAIAPDGSYVVYTANGSLWLRPVGRLQATLMSGTEGASEPFVSADSQWIGFWSGGQLKKVAVSGGAAVTLAETDALFGASWGDDDRILFGQGSEGIWQVPGSGGTPEVVIEVDSSGRGHGPQMLPGGEWVLFTFRPANTAVWDESQIIAQSLATGERMVLIQGGRDGRYLPTGHLVYSVNGVVFGVAFDADTRQVIGGAVPLIEGVRDSGNTGATQFSVANNGSLVYRPGRPSGGAQRAIVWVDRDGTQVPLSLPARPYYGVSLSPDGARVAVGSEDANVDVWVGELARGSLAGVTTDPAVDSKPLWSPDGQSVVFESLRGGAPALYRKSADGTGVAEHLFSFDGETATIAPYEWTPDGTALVVVVDSGTDPDIGLISLDPSGSWEPLVQTEAVEWAPAISPDGRWIAYTSNETGLTEVYVQRFPDMGDRRAISIGGGFAPTWSADGRELFYLRAPSGPPDGMMQVAIESDATTLTAGQPEELFEWPYYSRIGRERRYDLSDDGRFLTVGSDAAATTEAPAFDLVLVLNWFAELQARVPTGR